MRTVDARTGLEVLEREEAVRLLATQEIGRLGFESGGGLEILPVNYVLDGEVVVFATADGAKLRGVAGSTVVFEVDEMDRTTRSGWSVVVHGRADQVTEHDSRELLDRARNLPLQPWADFPKPHLIRITPRFISGRRVRATLPHG